MSIGVQMIARGKAMGEGVTMPEFAFDPKDIFNELKKRDIFMHEKVVKLK
jgi:hypothetical protein